MSKNYRVWKWNVLANIRPIFFFLIQLYLCTSWFQVRSSTKNDHENNTLIAFDSNPLSNLAFILCIVHAVLALVTFIPRGVVSLVAHFDSPSSKRLCEWSAVSSGFLSLVILSSQRKGINGNKGDSTLTFFSSILVNIAAFNHIGIPDLFLIMGELTMIPVWIIFFIWTAEEERSTAAVLAGTFVLCIIVICTWLQQRDYRRAFDGQQGVSKIDDEFLRSINHALKLGDDKLRNQTVNLNQSSHADQRLVLGNITSIRYWYLAISAALSPKEELDEKYTSLTFVQMCREVFADYEKAVGNSVPIFFDTTHIDLKITARSNLFQTLIFGLLEYKNYRDQRISRICRFSCVDDDGKDWKLIFEIVSLLGNDADYKREGILRRNSRNKASTSLHGWAAGQAAIKNDISLKYPLSLEKEPVAKSDFESTISGSILTVIAEKLWQHKFEHSTDETEEFFVEKIEISLPNDICTVQSDLNASAVGGGGGSAGTGASAAEMKDNHDAGGDGAGASSFPDKKTDAAGNDGGSSAVAAAASPESLAQLNVAFPASKYQPWIIITQRIPESITRMEIRSKLNKLLVPTQLVSLQNIRNVHRFGIVLISEQLLGKLAHAARDEAADYPDLLSIRDLRTMARYLIVVCDHDHEKSELSQSFGIDVDRTIKSKATLNELFDSILQMYTELRQDFDAPKNEGTDRSGRPNRSPEMSPTHAAADERARASLCTNGMDSTDQLLECTVRIRRWLQKKTIQENDPEDVILQDAITNIKAQARDLQNAPPWWNPAIDAANASHNGSKNYRCAAVLQSIEDVRRRLQAEIAMEFLPKFAMIQDMLNQSPQSIDWHELGTKLQDVQALATNKRLVALVMWLRTLVEVVNIFSNKWQEFLAAKSRPNKREASRVLEDVVEDIEETDTGSGSSSGKESGPGHSTGNGGLHAEDAFLDEDVMSYTRQIFSTAQLILLNYIMT